MGNREHCRYHRLMTAASDEAFKARLAALVAAFDELGHDAEDADADAYRRLTWLADAMHGRSTFWARIRARAVLARWKVGDLSYQQLADHLGVSKTRAAQLVKAAKKHADD